jgi:hypothetical protein
VSLHKLVDDRWWQKDCASSSEFHFDLPGERYAVSLPSLGAFGLLVEHDGDLKLVVEGRVFRPEDELRGVRLEVRIAEPEKVGTHRVVQEWNRAVSAATQYS